MLYLRVANKAPAAHRVWGSRRGWPYVQSWQRRNRVGFESWHTVEGYNPDANHFPSAWRQFNQKRIFAKEQTDRVHSCQWEIETTWCNTMSLHSVAEFWRAMWVPLVRKVDVVYVWGSQPETDSRSGNMTPCPRAHTHTHAPTMNSIREDWRV